MGLSTETKNVTLGIDRKAQDEVAAASHQRAAAAIADGTFDVEIAPVSVKQRKGDPLVLTTDEGVRPNTTVETLAPLKAAFATDGTITAGNSSPLSDGASALVLTSRRFAEGQRAGLPGRCGQTRPGCRTGQLAALPAVERHCASAEAGRLDG